MEEILSLKDQHNKHCLLNPSSSQDMELSSVLYAAQTGLDFEVLLPLHPEH